MNSDVGRGKVAREAGVPATIFWPHTWYATMMTMMTMMMMTMMVMMMRITTNNQAAIGDRTKLSEY